jgi:hypothetical protein
MAIATLTPHGNNYIELHGNNYIESHGNNYIDITVRGLVLSSSILSRLPSTRGVTVQYLY